MIGNNLSQRHSQLQPLTNANIKGNYPPPCPYTCHLQACPLSHLERVPSLINCFGLATFLIGYIHSSAGPHVDLLWGIQETETSIHTT